MTVIDRIPEGIFNCFFLFLFLGVLGLIVFGVIRVSVSPDRSRWERSRRDDEPPDAET